MQQDYRSFIIHLSLIDGIGPATVKMIIERMLVSNDNFYDYTSADLQQLFGFSVQKAQRLVDGLRNQRIFEEELDLIIKNNVSVVTFFDEEYPTLLKTITAPPALLYCRGHLPTGASSLAVVGARAATYYVQQAIQAMVPVFVEHGLTIVSGGALGADTMAHQATLAAGGATAVILGSGLLAPYPLSNVKLFDEVVAREGAVISSFPLRMEPLPGNFPARNRIIAGLSRGCFVVQAATKSGALITASYALQEGRDVFALPGPYYDPLSAGCHLLIQQGAKLVMDAADILQEFGIAVPVQEFVQEKVMREKNVIVQKTNKTPEDQLVVLCAEPLSLEELCEKSQKTVGELQMRLFELQLEGKIKQNFAGLWERV